MTSQPEAEGSPEGAESATLEPGPAGAEPAKLEPERESAPEEPAASASPHEVPPHDTVPLDLSPTEARSQMRIRRRQRRRVVTLVVGACLALLLVAGLVAAALLAWPQARIVPSNDALARVMLPSFAGQVTAVDVRSAGGEDVPVQLRQGQIWPMGQLAAGEWLKVELTTSRPRWASWLVGSSRLSRFTIQTPVAHLHSHWLTVKAGAPVSVAFDTPVQLVSLGGSPAQSLPAPQTAVPIGVNALGSQSSGTIQVAVAARPWERLSAPILVSWFTSHAYPQLLAEPATTATLTPDARLTLTFSKSIKTTFGKKRPKLSPAVPGQWKTVDTHTLAFLPSGYGYGMGATVHVKLPAGVHLAGNTGSKLTRTLTWHVPRGSTTRLHQLLALLGYLPVDWQPASAPASDTLAAELAAAVSPPPGTFTWRYAKTPPELHSQWRPNLPTQITRGAVMMFEDTHGMDVDGLAGPTVWSAMIKDVMAGKRRTVGYNYVFVHRKTPQLLSLWHNGRVILTSPGNTGVPAAPTKLGTFPVFEHIRVGTMSGTNPNGSHYKDPGIRWISYFNGGEALHAFNRASFGTPQSLGCVELPLAAAAKVWPYTPIGTLVTIEN
jgi:lipoprotein-anchoring transpeptidase ErfK/SrfK